MVPVSVGHFTSELFGGAGIAAQRLHAALPSQNVQSLLYYDVGTPLVGDCVPIYRNQTFFRRNLAALGKSWRHRRNSPTGFVTSPRWIRKTLFQSLDKIPDIVNLHWISRWIDLPSFVTSLPKNIPIVWSLHDMNPLTGGCHHAGGCNHFTDHCGYCPQVKNPSARDVAYRFFKIKSRCYEGLNLHFVGNSEWTTTQAHRSGLARYAKSFHTIPLGVNIEQFQPIDKSCARRGLGITQDRFVIGFGCTDFNDENKGGALLVEVLRTLATQHKVTLLTFGTGKLPLIGSDIELLELGVVGSPRVQSLFYSAADIFVTPSRVESFGLTALEAMACGTAVVAFRTSGLKDIVIDGETGLLEADIGSVSGLKAMIKWMVEHKEERQNMGVRSRKRVESFFTDTLMAKRYAAIYTGLCLNNCT